MVTDFYPPFLGGVEVVVRNLATALAGRGHDVSVATLRADGAPAFEEDRGVRVHRIPSSAHRVDALFSQRRQWAPPAPDPEATFALRRIVVRENPEVVHGHDWLARSFLPLTARSDAAFVVSVHYYTLSCAKKSLMFRGLPCSGPGLVKCLGCASRHYGKAKGSAVTLANFAFAAAERRSVDLFVAVSRATAAGNGLTDVGAPVEVIPNFLADHEPQTPDLEPLLAELPDTPFLLFVGDLRRDKGVHVLLEAYTRLVAPPPLVLIGKTWPETPTHFPKNTIVLRDWPNPAVREAQRRCLALVAPSLWPEPFGMVVIEALAAGRPVVASRIGGITDLVDDDVTGLLVAPGDVDALARAIERLERDRALRDRLSRAAAARGMEFRAQVVVPRFERAYERAIARARRR